MISVWSRQCKPVRKPAWFLNYGDRLKAFVRILPDEVQKGSGETRHFPDCFTALKGGDHMRVTEVRVHPVDDNDKLKAFASIALDDAFMIRDLRIIQGTKGLFVAMPSKKRKDGSYRDTAHPINNETRQMIEEKVINEYRNLVHNQDENNRESQFTT